MHPAYSVIFFTVLSGAGFGLLALLSAAPLLGIGAAGSFALLGFGSGMGLAIAGLLLSTLHLRRPERAWRALSQWRSSWLSREGVLAIAALAFAAIHAAMLIFKSENWVILAVFASALSLGTVYATGMIYAQLRTVVRWWTGWTPACFLGFSVAGGALLFANARFFTSTEQTAGGEVAFAIIALVAAWAIKLAWWKRGDSAKPPSTPESATGLGRVGRVRLLESPHSGESYLTKEMGYKIARKHASKLRVLALVFGFAVPAILSATAFVVSGESVLLSLALISYFAGTLAERWLFFAESEHAVMTFY
ncbi:MAG: dimethyl sulfoxide reductase anchor subunit [Albidovulum sp.]|nr:dimethyl sulfoxide reductase anchor subunit [Albidovulum sp.]